jgi:hypothetical protein
MRLKKLLIALLSCVCVMIATAPALACACCINPGYYEISTVKPSTADISMMDEFKFDTTAQFYMSEAGFDSLRGLAELKKDDAAGKSIDLSLVETFLGRGWRFDLKTAAGRAGSLSLPMPSTMVRFKVDQHQNQPDREPFLYKELRFKGQVRSGTGFFKKDVAKPASYFLVFQGYGNGCDSSSDYTHWRLELNGPNADYAFFGKLNQS